MTRSAPGAIDWNGGDIALLVIASIRWFVFASTCYRREWSAAPPGLANPFLSVSRGGASLAPG